MRLFVRVVERRSFRAAASDLGLPRSSATAGIKALEAALGTTLLRRSTRHVAPTDEGAGYHRHCVAILGEMDAVELALRGGAATGVLRVDTTAQFAPHPAAAGAPRLPRKASRVAVPPQRGRPPGQPGWGGGRLRDPWRPKSPRVTSWCAVSMRCRRSRAPVASISPAVVSRARPTIWTDTRWSVSRRRAPARCCRGNSPSTDGDGSACCRCG